MSTINPVTVGSSALPTGAATDAKLDEIKALLGGSGLAQYVDGLETALATLNGYVDQVEGKLDTINTGLTNVAGFVDGLEALATTLNSKDFATEAKLEAVRALLAGTLTTAPSASSGAGGITSTARLASAAGSTNATNVKTSAGRIYSAQGYNAAAYPVYLVLYDSATNPPVPGTTTIRKKIPIPALSAFALDWPVGMSFASGIGYAFTKLAADADTTALVAADVLQFNLDYV